MLEEIAQEPRTLHGPKCDLEKAVKASPELEADIIAAILSPYDATKVARVFERNGINIKPITIRRHRNRECVSCQIAGRFP